MGKNGEDKIGAVTFRKIKKNRRMLFLRGPVGLFIFLRNDFFSEGVLPGTIDRMLPEKMYEKTKSSVE